MNNTEEQHPVFIPRNFIEKGTFMGGMFKIRNAIEGGVLAILITIPVINLPLTLTVRIIILCMTALPAAMISLIAFSEKPPGYLPYGCTSGAEKKVPDKKAPQQRTKNQETQTASKTTCKIFF